LAVQDDQTVIDTVLRDLERLYPLAADATLVKAKLVRIPQSVYRASPGIEGAVRSARAAVDAVLARRDAGD
jgi:hypothetical protein